DRPSRHGSAFSQALWAEHQRRIAARLNRLRADLPRPRVPDRDPWALRAVAALVFVAALSFSPAPQGRSIADAFRQRPTAEAVPPRIDAWVTPPAYTGKPPIFLPADANQGAGAFIVPQGSDVTLRVTGGAG